MDTEKRNDQTIPSGEPQMKENKMGTMPIPRLLFSMAVPMMISMLVQALYNVVDSIFVAQLSEDALTSVSLAFPMQNLMIAVAAGIGVGTNAMLSKKLGEKEFKTASSAAVHGIFLCAIAYGVFAVFGIFFTRTFFLGQTDIPVIIDGGVEYLTTICILSFGLFGQVIMERLLQSTGKTFYSMITQATGAIINIILDPMLIFGLCGLPRMGIRGAAVATVFGQFVATMLAIYFNVKKNKEISLSFRGFRPRANMIGRILYVGVPSIIMVAITSVTIFGLNRILMQFSSTAAAVLGAYFKLQSFIMMPVFGLNNGMIPIVAYNYSSGNENRMHKIIRTARFAGLTVAGISIAALMTFAEPLPRLFLSTSAGDVEAALMTVGYAAVFLRIRCLASPFQFLNYHTSFCMQGMGKGKETMLHAIVRELVFYIPLMFLLDRLFGEYGLASALPAGEACGACFALVLLRHILRKAKSENNP